MTGYGAPMKTSDNYPEGTSPGLGKDYGGGGKNDGLTQGFDKVRTVKKGEGDKRWTF